MTNENTTPSNLQLFFKGLFTFCFSQDIVVGTEPEAEECQVGVLSTAPGHQLKITIVKETAGIPEVSSVDITPTLGRGFRYITLQTPEDLPGVTCPRLEPVDRTDPPSHSPGEYDFRWIIDFEGREFYDSTLSLTRGVFLPIISIRTGRFYTNLVTEPAFVQIQGQRIKVPFFGHVAEVMASDITLPPGSHFALKLGEIPLVEDEITDDGKKYRIYFENSCPRLRKRSGDRPTAAVKTYLENNMFLLELQGLMNISAERRESLLRNDTAGTDPSDGPILDDEQAEEVLAEEPSDIQYYHHGFDKRPLDWFDLRLFPDGRGVRPAICYPSLLGTTRSLPTEEG